MAAKDPVPCILVYVPVVHTGYIEFFNKYPTAIIYVLGDDILARFPHLKKDIRALSPDFIMRSLKIVLPNRCIAVLGETHLAWLTAHEEHIIMPDEDISAELATAHFTKAHIQFDTVFLRYDKKRSETEFEVRPERTVGVTDLDRELMKRAHQESEKSSDWWRQIGGLIVAPDGSVLLIAHNHHVPTPDNPYILGDPRGNYKKGVNIELGTALHAEKSLICEAARRGIALEGTYLYVTTFPCPPCAKAVAYSGIKKLYYHTGYAMVDGESILKINNVELIQVVL